MPLFVNSNNISPFLPPSSDKRERRRGAKRKMYLKNRRRKTSPGKRRQERVPWSRPTGRAGGRNAAVRGRGAQRRGDSAPQHRGGGRAGRAEAGGARWGERRLPGKSLSPRRALSERFPGAGTGQSDEGCLGRRIVKPVSPPQIFPPVNPVFCGQVWYKRVQSNWYTHRALGLQQLSPVRARATVPSLGVPLCKVSSTQGRRGCVRRNSSLRLQHLLHRHCHEFHQLQTTIPSITI